MQISLLSVRDKNENSKPAGFADCPNPGYWFGKMSGFPLGPGFSKPGFQSLVLMFVHKLLFVAA